MKSKETKFESENRIVSIILGIESKFTEVSDLNSSKLRPLVDDKLKNLSDVHRKILEYKYFKGWNIVKIAAEGNLEIKVSEDSHDTLHEIHKQLKKALNHLKNDFGFSEVGEVKFVLELTNYLEKNVSRTVLTKLKESG